MSAYAKLSRRRQRFVDEYVACGVGARAVRACGFTGKRADIAASKWLAIPEVRLAVRERTEEAIAGAGVRAVRVLEELAAIALFNRRQLRGPKGELLPIHELPDAVNAAIAGEEFDSTGTLRKYRTHSKTEALAQLLKYLRLVVEQHEHSGPGGEPIPVREVSDLEKARRIAYLLAQGIQGARAEEAPPPDSDTDDD